MMLEQRAASCIMHQKNGNIDFSILPPADGPDIVAQVVHNNISG